MSGTAVAAAAAAAAGGNGPPATAAAAAADSPPLLLTPDDEQGLAFVALMGLRDPPRTEAAAALAACRAAGVRVIMITGDSRPTAEAVARDLGLLPARTAGGSANGDNIGVTVATTPAAAAVAAAAAAAVLPGGGMQQLASLTGAEFDALAPAQQAAAAGTVRVLSRVEPLHKLRLVELLRSQVSQDESQ
jgi:magnesium-transporting ATPase (P-type)